MRVGNQEPTFQRISEYENSVADEAVEMFRSYGFNLMEWQQMQFALMLAVDEAGKVAAKSLCFSVPRQNGKSFAARLYAIWMSAVKGRAVLYSAHNGDTVRKFFRMLEGLFASPERYPDFAEITTRIVRQAGSEGIYFSTGGFIEFSTRTNNGVRGGTYDVVIIDEAQEYTSEQQDAMKPTTSASNSGDSQTIYIGTPPSAKCSGDVFKRMHDKAHGDKPSKTWWVEWGIDHLPEQSLSVDELYELAWRFNPSMGKILNEDDIYDEAETMSLDGYARERLGWWSKGFSTSVITEANWSKCVIAKPERNGLTCYAAKFSPDGRYGTLSACIKQPDGTYYVCVVDRRSMENGAQWAIDWLVRHESEAAQIVVDGKAHSESLVTGLQDGEVAKNVIVQPSASDVADACSMFLNAVNEGKIRHTSQGALNHSALNTQKRLIGKSGGWAFDSIGESDPTVIESCALAYWQCVLTKRDPSRKLRIG